MRTSLIAPEYGVVADERERLGDALRDEEAIEGVLVDARKPGDTGRVRRADRQLQQPHGRKRLFKRREIDDEILAPERILMAISQTLAAEAASFALSSSRSRTSPGSRLLLAAAHNSKCVSSRNLTVSCPRTREAPSRAVAR